MLEGLQANCSKPLDIQEIGGKGRGVIATAPILKGQFVTEYKCYMQYPLSQKCKHILEYKDNSEGSFILEAQLPDGKWICLDATRRMNCFGRCVIIEFCNNY